MIVHVLATVQQLTQTISAVGDAHVVLPISLATLVNPGKEHSTLGCDVQHVLVQGLLETGSTVRYAKIVQLAQGKYQA